MTDTPIFCAIDTTDIEQAKNLIKQATAAGCGTKLGLTFFNAHGPQGIQTIMDECDNPIIFLDLKYHDIPAQVAGCVKAVADLRVAYLNVHASGGLEMMRAAKAACPDGTKLLAVTLLTSLDENAINEIGYKENISDRVIQLAKLTQEAGLDGVVCSSHEIEAIRAACGDGFILMVPGIRPKGSDAGDQKRIMTPKEAMDKGATHLVIGRPITQSENPQNTASEILKTLK